MWFVTHKHEQGRRRLTWPIRWPNACSGRPVEVPPSSLGRLPSGDGGGSTASNERASEGGSVSKTNLPSSTLGARANRERCPHCGRRLVSARFDCVFRYPEVRWPTMFWGDERRIFGIPGAMCEQCSRLYLDPELIELLDLASARCVMAIQSDAYVQAEALEAGA